MEPIFRPDRPGESRVVTPRASQAIVSHPIAYRLPDRLSRYEAPSSNGRSPETWCVGLRLADDRSTGRCGSDGRWSLEPRITFTGNSVCDFRRNPLVHRKRGVVRFVGILLTDRLPPIRIRTSVPANRDRTAIVPLPRCFTGTPVQQSVSLGRSVVVQLEFVIAATAGRFRPLEPIRVAFLVNPWPRRDEGLDRRAALRTSDLHIRAIRLRHCSIVIDHPR